MHTSCVPISSRCVQEVQLKSRNSRVPAVCQPNVSISWQHAGHGPSGSDGMPTRPRQHAATSCMAPSHGRQQNRATEHEKRKQGAKRVATCGGRQNPAALWTMRSARDACHSELCRCPVVPVQCTHSALPPTVYSAPTVGDWGAPAQRQGHFTAPRKRRNRSGQVRRASGPNAPDASHIIM